MNFIRKLSDVEATFGYMHAELRGTTQITTLLSVNSLFRPELLAHSVATWARRIPILSLRIRETLGELWFCQGPAKTEDQFRLSQLHPGQSPDATMAVEVNDILPTGGPLWRLHAFAEPTAGSTHFFFTRNHAISDGYATGVVMKALLDVLFGGANLTEAPAFDTGSGRLPPRSDLLTYTPPSAETPETAPPMPEYVGQVPFFKNSPWTERRTGFITVDLTRDESASVQRTCKKHGLTINEFFATALAEAFAETVCQETMGLYTAVSLRKRYAETGFLLEPGCFISVVQARLRLGGSSLVANARTYRTSLRVADAEWRPPQRTHAEIRSTVEGMAALQSFPGICITNVGRVDGALGDQAGRVTGFRTVVNRTGANYGIVLHLSTLNDSFGLTLAYGTPSMDRNIVHHVAALIGSRARARDGLVR